MKLDRSVSRICDAVGILKDLHCQKFETNIARWITGVWVWSLYFQAVSNRHSIPDYICLRYWYLLDLGRYCGAVFVCEWRAFYMPFCLTVWHIWPFAPALVKKINFYRTEMAVLTNYALLCEQAYWIAFSKWKIFSVYEGKDLNCQNVSQWHFHTIKL